MRRGFLTYAALAALCAALAGCDKCTGGFEDLRFPQVPKSCSDRTQR